MDKISLKERLSGAIWGQFVGDAAGLGTHLIEDEKEIQEHFPAGIHGFDPPFPGHLHENKTQGDLTHYGDAAFVFLKSLASHHSFSARDFGTLFVETFAAPDYPNPINKTTREMIDNYHLSLEEGHPDLGFEFQGGANTIDVDSATRMAPLVALYWEDPKLLSIVDKATRVVQNNEITVAYMRSYARILRSLFQGEELRTILFNETHPAANDSPLDRHVREKISLAFELEDQNICEAVKKLGLKSHLDQAYPAAVHTCLKHQDSFTEAVIDTITARGDGSGRAAIAGAWLGASLGQEAVPKAWRQRLTHFEKIKPAIETLLNIKAAKN